jgi:hypothetical protein
MTLSGYLDPESHLDPTPYTVGINWWAVGY